MFRIITPLLLVGCTPSLDGSWDGLCSITLNPAVFADPSEDLGPHEWEMDLDITEEKGVLTGSCDFTTHEDVSILCDLEGERSKEDEVTLALEYLHGSLQGHFEFEGDYDPEDLIIAGDISWYNDKDGFLQGDGDCEYQFLF